MSDREQKLLERWRGERAMYAAWGNHVTDVLTKEIGRRISPVSTELYFRIPVRPRVKEEGSLLAKAFHRGKAYTNPYDDIEDKVGLRIVVLFLEDIREVERAIKDRDDWLPTLARDFEEEKTQKPFEFDYQSLHYIVRSKNLVVVDGIEVKPDTPCEIQVRTLLQHAYSELTHDTIYKPKVRAEPAVKRAAAKSMALIEATDDYFLQVRKSIEAAKVEIDKLTVVIESLYREYVGGEPEMSPLNEMLIDHFKQWAKLTVEADVRDFLAKKPFVIERIRSRARSNLLFRQPAILLAYFAIASAPMAANLASPLSPEEVTPIYTDLGLDYPH